MNVANCNSHGNWVVTAPTVQFNDGGEISTDNGNGPTPLAIHTNNLNLGDGSNGSSVYIYGDGVTIDDNGGKVFTTTGLMITGVISNSEYIQSFDSPLVISATASQTSSLEFTANGSGSIYLDGVGNHTTAGVVLSASNTLTVDGSLYLANYYSSGNWVITAPTVTLNYAGEIDTTYSGYGASLTIHTDNLNLGSAGSIYSNTILGNGVTIDDNGGSVFTTTGLLTITASTTTVGEYIRSVGSPLFISATGSSASSLLITTIGNNGGILFLDGDNGNGTFGVALSASHAVTIDQLMTVENKFSNGNWVVTAPTISMNDGSTLDSTNANSSQPATLAIHTNNLNLGDFTNDQEAEIFGNGITIDDNGGSVFATVGLTVNTARSNAYIASAGAPLLINATASSNSSVLFTEALCFLMDPARLQ